MAEPAEIADASNCFVCFSPLQRRAAIVYLLNQIANTGYTPEQLAAASNCFTCLTKQQANAANVYLLDQIL